MAKIDQDWIDECERAALNGEIDALYQLGLCYASGRGVVQDYVTAHKWFNLAAVRGNDDALHNRKELTVVMTGEEVAEAQRQARQWVNESAHFG